MPKNSSADAMEAIHRSFEPADDSSTRYPSAECAAWVDDRLNEWFNE